MILRTVRILFIVFIIVPFSSVSSQTINKIILKGNTNFSQSNYINWIGIESGTTIYKGFRDSVKVEIIKNLSDEGYFFSKIDSIKFLKTADSQKIDLEISLTEGKPTFISNVFILAPDSTESKMLSRKFDFVIGSVFNRFELESVIGEILENYENNSFPFSMLKTKSVFLYADSTKNNNYVDVYFSIDKGLRGKIDKIVIIGNTNTNDNVIIRSTRIDTGYVYSQKKIEEIPKKLNNLRFFEPVKQPSFYIDSDKNGVLQITVKEKQTNNFDGIIGYVPASNNNATGYFTGFLNISLRNLFGTGRGAAFKWQKLDQSSQILDIKYLEPWLFGYPINAQLSLFQRKQDSTYIQRKFSASLDYLATANLSAAFIFTTESTIPTVNGNNRFTVFNSSTVTTGINIKYDSRDDFYAPTKGVVFQTKYSLSNKTITGPKNFITAETNTKSTLQRLEVDFSFFYQLFSKNIAAISVFARELRADSFEISELYRLGGANTLRGYIEDQFLGNRIFWSNLEYRVLMAKRTYAFLFLDTGYFFRSEDIINSIKQNSAWKLGFGFGINLETTLGVLRVGYALGQGDSFNQGKIHFGLLNEF